MKKMFLLLPIFFIYFFFTPSAFAHEAYVLTQEEFQQGLAITTSNPLAPLLDLSHLGLTIFITIAVVLAYVLVLLWATTPWATKLDKLTKKLWVIGPLIIRLALSASFFYAALANAILGPELSLAAVAGGSYIRMALFALAIMIFLGFFTEIAAGIGLAIFFYVSFIFQWYMVTYANYFGELIVLFLFGSRFFSIDRYLFGKHAWNLQLEKLRSLEIPIVRVLYGIALMYAGWTIKFAHQSLTVAVYNQYHLVNFFHASASFIAAGAGLTEILIGLFILVGFAQRFTVLISLFFITISILYFQEMLWPHFMLYGISLSLLVNSADAWTVDRYFIPFVRRLFFSKQKSKKK